VDYKLGIPVHLFVKNKTADLKQYSNANSFLALKDIFAERTFIAGQANPKTTIFSYAANKTELNKFSKISGESNYKGREGIEFFPQELYVLKVDNTIRSTGDNVFVTNFQNKKSKYKIPLETFTLEKKYLQPLIRGVDIERFHLKESSFIVPFPYDEDNKRSPIPMKVLVKRSRLLAKYFNRFKNVIESQTDYSAKIIGAKHNTEFYALARVGEYSFAKNYVAFRDNTKWQSVVVSSIRTPWGELKRPQFQNHAVSICQDNEGRFISLSEAHFICAILNAPLTKKYILNSSDSRSFKINPPICIPKFDRTNKTHRKLSELSIKAHKHYGNKKIMGGIDSQLNSLIIKLKKGE
jgi:hypothetical protein